jgi:membrane fusion protein, multidrug efflux system
VSNPVDNRTRRRVGRALGVAIVLGAIVTSLWAWWLTWRHPRTDDAAVRANVIGIAPHVNGPIVELPVVDNQSVRAGDLLFAIDARPYEARLEAARAELSLTTSEIAAQHDSIAAAEAEISRREAEAAYAADYLRRVEPLGRKFVSTDKVEEARVKQRSADAALRQARHERERAQNLLAQVGELNARRQAAEAAVRAAELDVGYCRVTAPFDGYVTNLNIAVGEYARQGQQVFALVDGREWYVIANFKETYLDAIRPGMEAEVFLLSYPNRRFRGEVQGVGWAVHPLDGATVGVLPAVQPSLNWVRLAQRFPVRIRLEDPDVEHPFRMGTTAVVTILGGHGESVAAARGPE